ncbi:MAG: phage tail protein [Succinivibrio sp.]
MSQEMDIIITSAGLQALINAEHSGTNKVTLSKVKLGNAYFEPSEQTTEIGNVVAELTSVGGSSVSATEIQVNATDSSDSVYTVRSVGIYTSDGLLFAVGSSKEPILQKVATSQALFTFNVLLTNGNPQYISFGDISFSNPPATTTTPGITRFATNSEAEEAMSGTVARTPLNICDINAKGAVLKGLCDCATLEEIYTQNKILEGNEKVVTSLILQNILERCNLLPGSADENKIAELDRRVTSLEDFETEFLKTHKLPKTGSIGVPGTKGFGIGIYPGTESELIAMGLEPMSGYNDSSSDNYGNYMHYKGGQMIFIPAFLVRYGNENAPQYASYGVNSIEIKDVSDYESLDEAAEDGFYLHRAFIDGNEVKKGFFVSKYHMTVTTVGSESVPVSGMTTPTVSITPVQMIDYARSLGYGWNCPSAFIMAAVDVIALCHAQFATWTTNCRWYDPTGTTSYPAQGRGSSDMGLYSHNGQPCGLIGFEFRWEYCLGLTTAGTSESQAQTAVTNNVLYVMKKSMKLADITSGFGGETDAWGTTYTLQASHDAVTVDYTLTTSRITNWGNGENPVFTDPSTEEGNALFGVMPRNDSAVGTGSNFIGKSMVYTNPCTQNLAFYVHGENVNSSSASQNAFARYFTYLRVNSDPANGFRVAGYAA